MQKFLLENLDCTSCANKVEKALKKMQCVENVRINFNTSTLYITTNDIESVKNTIKTIEPQIILKDFSTKTSNDSNYSEILLLSVLLFCFFLSLGLLHYTPLESFCNAHIVLPSLTFLGINNEVLPNKILAFSLLFGIYIIAGTPIFQATFKNLKNKIFFDENVLMLTATLAALCIGEISEAVAVTLFFRIGEFLESFATKRSKKSINALLEIMPEIAHKQVRANPIDSKLAHLDNEGEKQKFHDKDLLQESSWHDIHPEFLEIKDIILVKVGEKIPTDGIVLQGQSYLNTQSLTGESKPLSIKVGEKVLGGSINLTQALIIEVQEKFENSQIAKIKEMVENASNTKPKTQKIITKFAQVYTPIMFFIALFIALIPPIFVGQWHEWIYRSLVVLMVSCPCALVLSVPLGYFGALGIASKRGILIKGSHHLETLAGLKHIVFDKTGTLTQGSFSISKIVACNGYSQDEVLSIAVCAERFSNHPIAKSIIKESKSSHECTITEHKEIAGKGVYVVCHDEILAGNLALMQEYNVDTSAFQQSCKELDSEILNSSVVHVAKNATYMGFILINDSLREESKEVLDGLRQLQINPLAILSGDNEKNVAFVAKQLGIKHYFSQLLPMQKAEILKKLKVFCASTHKDSLIMNNANLQSLCDCNASNLKSKQDSIAFVGDGINDSVVLSSADIGISINAKDSYNDISKESADIILTTPSLMGLLQTIKIAKKIRIITWQNIVFVLSIKLLLVILGIFGIANMWIAVFGDVGVALLSLLNAMRVMR